MPGVTGTETLVAYAPPPPPPAFWEVLPPVLTSFFADPPAPPPPQHSTWTVVTPDGQVQLKVPGVLNVSVAALAKGEVRERTEVATTIRDEWKLNSLDAFVRVG